MLVLPSPKNHNQSVIGDVPAVDKSVNCTVNGAFPLVGVPEKSAVGPIGLGVTLI